MKVLLTSIALSLPITALGWKDTSRPPERTTKGPFLVGARQAPSRVDSFPPFDYVRSDYLAPEGTKIWPLNISPNQCSLTPIVYWQTGFCESKLATVYEQANWFFNTPDAFYTWIISVNNEPVHFLECSSGPPNASLPLNGEPFSMIANKTSLALSIKHSSINDNCSKIPYLSAAYIRGVQAGDPARNIFTWNEARKKVIQAEMDFNVRPSPAENVPNQLQWILAYLHYRDPSTGQRYMVKVEFISPDDHENIYLTWNWPFVNSFQYPGSIIAVLAATRNESLPIGRNQIELDITQLGLQAFPEFAQKQPDFLGVEFGVESAFGPFHTFVVLRNVRFVEENKQ
jgi:hypothetical protein